MDNLSLLYEKQTIKPNQIRPDLLNHILECEKNKYYNTVKDLCLTLNESEKEALIEEGLYDRLKAKGAGVIGKGQQAVGGAINRAGQAGANLASKFGANIDPNKNKVAQYGQQLQQKGKNSKLDSYKNSAISNIVNDLSKLGYTITDVDQFKQSLTGLIDNAVGGNQQPTNAAPTQPPPLPANQQQQPQTTNTNLDTYVNQALPFLNQFGMLDESDLESLFRDSSIAQQVFQELINRGIIDNTGNQLQSNP